MKVAVLGAGLSGLIAALELTKSNKVKEVVVFEQDNKAGGLMRSEAHKDLIWDYGAYTFSKENELVKMFPHLFSTIPVQRKILFKGEYSKFPVDLKRILKNKTTVFFFKAMLQFFIGFLKRVINTKENTALKWMENRLTSIILIESGIDQYISKVQGGKRIDELSNSLVKDKFSYLFKNKNLLSLLSSFLKKESKGISAMEEYPIHTGVEGIISGLESECKNNGVVFSYNSKIKKINTECHNYAIIHFASKTNIVKEKFDHIVSSINLHDLHNILEPKPAFKRTCSNSTPCYTSTLAILLGLSTISKTNKIKIIYSYEKESKWRRITLINRVNKPISATIEYTSPDINNSQKEHIINGVLAEIIEQQNIFSKDEISIIRSQIVKTTYPIFSLGYEAWVKEMHLSLDKKVTSLGRQGLFKYYDTSDVISTTRSQIKEFILN